MNKQLLIYLFFWITAFTSSDVAVAKVTKIEFTEFDTYSLEIIHINVGDSVKWLPTNEGHNVEFIMTPTMVSLPEKSKMNEPYSMIFQEAGIYVMDARLI